MQRPGRQASRGEAGRSPDEGVCSLSLFNVALQVLAMVVTQEKERKGIQMGKEVKLSSDDMVLCIQNHMESTKNLLDPKQIQPKFAEYNTNIQKSVVS